MGDLTGLDWRQSPCLFLLDQIFGPRDDPEEISRSISSNLPTLDPGSYQHPGFAQTF
jgi:hypothetical protein